MEGLLKKDKTYTYEELKEIYKEAMLKTMDKPTGDREKKEGEDSAKLQFSLMLSGMIILHTMEDNLFGKEVKEDN